MSEQWNSLQATRAISSQTSVFDKGFDTSKPPAVFHPFVTLVEYKLIITLLHFPNNNNNNNNFLHSEKYY